MDGELTRRAAGLGLAPEDFDAFLVPDAGSTGPENLRQRVRRWSNGVLGRLAALGLVAELTVTGGRSAAEPGLRALFVRDEVGRSHVARASVALELPSHGTGQAAPGRLEEVLGHHALLSFALDSVHVEVALELGPHAALDLANLRARLRDPSGALELVSAFERLPEGVAVGVLGVPCFPSAQRTSVDDLRALLDDAERKNQPLWIGRSVPRGVVVGLGATLDEELEAVLVAVAHVYRLVAWAPENDWARAATTGSARRGRKRREAPHEARESRDASTERRARRSGGRREREAARGHEEALEALEGEDAPEPSRAGRDEPVVSTRGKAAALLARAAVRGAAVTAIDPDRAIERGTRVQVLEGAFAGRVGVVGELEPGGRARVLFGLLATSVPVADLVAAVAGPRGKGGLRSSHRRVGRRKEGS